MASAYDAICNKNRERYGSEGAQKSGGLAAGLYADRAHFIFELLQNAEDALGRRGDWCGSRKVAFTLSPTHLRLSHFGKPFDEADVRSVCDIAESTKTEPSIGRFGLGFKSVYAVTDLPEIHSGDEDFAIEDYVFPKRLGRLERATDETQIILPFKPDDLSAAQDIAAGFSHLGLGTLLFLRHIDEIHWSVEGGASGGYRRHSPELLGANVQRITLIGKEADRPEVDESWLVFHRDVFSAEGHKVGRVEIAFSLVVGKDDPDSWTVQRLDKSPLVVFFPTVVESHLGFRVQGPYRTTPSRDNVLPGDPWNQHLVKETSSLLVEAMRWMRDNKRLTVVVLRCLPLNRKKFSEDSQFAPLFHAVRQAFQQQELLPTSDGRYATAGQAKLAQTEGLRELFPPEQVAELFGQGVAWLSGDITQGKAPEIRQYLMNELGIEEIGLTGLVGKLPQSFLEKQSDEWVLRLYESLNTARIGHLRTVPLIRLDNGTHVAPGEKGNPNAFLPSADATSFPTMRREVCKTDAARRFLDWLDIHEPDRVDDVIKNILPKYQKQQVNAGHAAYDADIERICDAFRKGTTAQKDKLQSALRDTSFVEVVDARDGKAVLMVPTEIYAADHLQQLFSGVPDRWIPNDKRPCLSGKDIHDLLVSCGAHEHLVLREQPLSDSEKKGIRTAAGLPDKEWEEERDWIVVGLDVVLNFLPKLKKPKEAADRAKVLWDALAHLVEQGDIPGACGVYSWIWRGRTEARLFDAKFVKELKDSRWVPNADGQLDLPRNVAFETLGWKSNPFLQEKIGFKRSIIDQLAKEAGIDPAILSLLQSNPSIVAELKSRLGASSAQAPDPSTGVELGAAPSSDGDVSGDDMPDMLPDTPAPHGNSGYGTSGDQGSKNGSAQGKRTPSHAGRQLFISYVGAHPDDGTDPDGLDRVKRMQIEKCAIDLIIQCEPALCRTPEDNPGFDLFEADNGGRQTRWVEVKSMTGSWEDCPVGLSHTQFDWARAKGDAYWLYVVEHATSPTKAHILRIQNPAGRARSFTFDRGWKDVAQADPS